MAYVTDVRGARVTGESWIRNLVADIRDRIARRRMYTQTYRELSNLSARELADLGIHRSMIGQIAYEAAYGDKA